MEQMKSRKLKSEPSLINKLSKPLRDFVDDITANGADALRAVRERDPAKYLELSTKLLPLIVALNPGVETEFSDCKSMADVGARLLRSVGVDPETITEGMIAAAIEANNEFVGRLERIKDEAILRDLPARTGERPH
jgi:hypothetical protein